MPPFRFQESTSMPTKIGKGKMIGGAAAAPAPATAAGQGAASCETWTHPIIKCLATL